MVLLFQSIITDPAHRELGRGGFKNGLTVAAYSGMFAGALFWGFVADLVGRKYAFNLSLFMCAVCCLVAGAMPSWPSLGLFIALLGFGAGGNLVMDTTVFLEYLPGNKQWLLTLLACWWGVGQTVTGFIGWGFLVPERWNCGGATACARSDNWGWRYALFTGGAIVLVMSVLRVTVVRLHETPKYQLSKGDDAELVETLHFLAHKYRRPCSLTLERLEACGTIRKAQPSSDKGGGSGSGSGSNKGGFEPRQTWTHFSGLFATRAIGRSTLWIWTSWTLIGLAYPLFYVFLPWAPPPPFPSPMESPPLAKNMGKFADGPPARTYQQKRGLEFDRTSFEKWRNYTIINVCGIPGPVAASFMCNTRLLGRRYTMAIGALLTMAFFFAYTAVKTPAQDTAFACLIAFCLNIYYGTLYAYTPEVLPSAHRGTGNGAAVACNRVMGIVSAVIPAADDESISVPLYVCAAIFILLAIVAGTFPFEPYGRRSS